MASPFFPFIQWIRNRHAHYFLRLLLKQCLNAVKQYYLLLFFRINAISTFILVVTRTKSTFTMQSPQQLFTMNSLSKVEPQSFRLKTDITVKLRNDPKLLGEVCTFLKRSPATVLGYLTHNHPFIRDYDVLKFILNYFSINNIKLVQNIDDMLEPCNTPPK